MIGKVAINKSDLSDDQLSSDFMNLFEDSKVVKVPHKYNITKEDLNITTNEQCYKFLDKCRYWMMNKIPDTVIQYMKTASVNEEFKLQIQNDFKDFFGFEIVYISENEEIDEEKTGQLAKNNRSWLIEYYHQLGKCKFDPYAIYCAAYNGHIDMIKLLRKIGCQWELKQFFCSGMNQLAAKNKKPGNYDLTYKDYQFLKNYYVYEDDLEDDTKFYHTCAIATGTQGHFECLKYIIENGCSYDEYLLRNIACFGRTEILKYLLSLHKITISNSEHIYHSALSHGYVECYKFLLEYFMTSPTTNDILSSFVSSYGRRFIPSSILNHDIDLLEYIISKGYGSIDYHLHNTLILRNKFNFIKMIHEKNINVTMRYKGNIYNANECAAYAGSIEMLKYFKNMYDTYVDSQDETKKRFAIARYKYYSWNDTLCDAAALNGHLETLQFLHESGCNWSLQTLKNTLENNHLDCAIYMLENGFEFDVVKPTKINKHQSVTSRWSINKTIPFDGTVNDDPKGIYGSRTFPSSISDKYTYIDILKYFNDKYDLDELQFNYYELVRCGNPECIQYAVDSGLLTIDIEYCKIALFNKNHDSIRYVLSKCTLTPDLFTAAYQTANIEVVKIVMELNCPIGERKQQKGYVTNKVKVYQEIDEFLDSL